MTRFYRQNIVSLVFFIFFLNLYIMCYWVRLEDKQGINRCSFRLDEEEEANSLYELIEQRYLTSNTVVKLLDDRLSTLQSSLQPNANKGG